MKILKKIRNIKHYISAIKIKRLNLKNEEFTKYSYNLEANYYNALAWDTHNRIDGMRIDNNLDTSWNFKN